MSEANDGRSRRSTDKDSAEDKIVEFKEEVRRKKKETYLAAPVIPHQVLPIVTVSLVLISVVLLLAALVPPPLHGPANKFETPKFLMPDWYFLWVYGSLKWTGWVYQVLDITPPEQIFGIATKDLLSAEVVGILLPGLFLLVLLVLPFLDRGPITRPTERPGKAAIGVAGMVLLLMLTCFGINGIIAEADNITLAQTNSILGISVVVLPVLSGAVSYLGLSTMRTGYEYLLNKCYQCGKCEEACPLAKVGDISDLNLVHNIHQNVTDGMWMCLTCDQCSAMCPQGLVYSHHILSLRRDRECKVVAHEGVFTELTEIMSSLDPPAEIPKSKSEYGYFGGCLVHLGAFMEVDVDYSEIEKASIKLLKSIGIEPAVLNLKCCGHDQLWQGGTEVFNRLREYNERMIAESGIETLIVSCAECYRTFKKDYNLDIEVVHISEPLANNRLELQRDGSGDAVLNVTYHDSCRLGRHMGIYKEPRAALEQVEGIHLVEMENNREDALCCGVAAMMNCNDKTMGLTAIRLEQAKAADVKCLLTSCTKCLAHLNCVKRGYALENGNGRYDFEIMDMSVFLADHLKERPNPERSVEGGSERRAGAH